MPASVLYMSMSLDGYIAGPNDDPGNPWRAPGEAPPDAREEQWLARPEALVDRLRR